MKHCSILLLLAGALICVPGLAATKDEVIVPKGYEAIPQPLGMVEVRKIPFKKSHPRIASAGHGLAWCADKIRITVPLRGGK